MWRFISLIPNLSGQYIRTPYITAEKVSLFQQIVNSYQNVLYLYTWGSCLYIYSTKCWGITYLITLRLRPTLFVSTKNTSLFADVWILYKAHREYIWLHVLYKMLIIIICYFDIDERLSCDKADSEYFDNFTFRILKRFEGMTSWTHIFPCSFSGLLTNSKFSNFYISMWVFINCPLFCWYFFH